MEAGSAVTKGALVSLQEKDDSVEVNTTVVVTVSAEYSTSVLLEDVFFMAV